MYKPTQLNRVLQVPPVFPYKALENFSKALYETTGGTCSAGFFRRVIMDGEKPPILFTFLMRVSLNFAHICEQLFKAKF